MPLESQRYRIHRINSFFFSFTINVSKGVTKEIRQCNTIESEL